MSYSFTVTSIGHTVARATPRRSALAKSRALLLSVALAGVAASITSAAAQCPAGWVPGIGSPGVATNGSVVYAVAVIPAGLPNAGDVIAAGSFTTVGGVAASNIARYNPSTGQWFAMASGLNSTVYALTVIPPGLPSAGDVIAGGAFLSSGPTPMSRIARFSFNTNSWSALGAGTSDLVFALAVIPAGLTGAGDVVVGGRFTTAGGVAGRRGIAKVTPASAAWSGLGAGLANAPSDYISALVIPPVGSPLAGSVFVGGHFSIFGGTSVNNLARHLLSTSQTLPVGLGTSGGTGPVPGAVYAMALSADVQSIFVGGEFAATGDTPANRITRFTAASSTSIRWLPVPTGVSGGAAPVVSALTTLPSGELIVGGLFSSAGGLPSANTARFSPATNTWTPAAGGGTNAQVYSLGTLGPSDAVLGGGFSATAGLPSGRLARYSVGTSAMTITTPPTSQSACAGSSVTLSVEVTPAGSYLYQWRRNGTDINRGVNPSAASAALTLTSLQAGDAGAYDCVITNLCSPTSSTTLTSPAATLAVLTGPSITAQPSSLFVCPGTPASFAVQATAQGPLSYQWRLAGTPISPRANPSAATPTLHIEVVQFSSLGTYDCLINAGCSTVASDQAQLTMAESCALADLADDPGQTIRCGNNSIGPEDLEAFVNGFLTGNTNVADVASDSADTVYNPDGSIGPEDLEAFLNSFIAGC